MHVMTLIGIVLGGATTVTDRVIHKIPNWLAVCLYGIALILMIAGLVVRRKAGACLSAYQMIIARGAPGHGRFCQVRFFTFLLIASTFLFILIYWPIQMVM